MTRVLDQIPMPQWALNEGARTAIEQIIADRPEPSIGDAMGFKVAHYRATSSASPVAQLRRLYRDWLDRECREVEAIFKATGVWDQEASNAVFRVEDADKLIGRVLRETAPRDPLEISIERDLRFTMEMKERKVA